MLHCAIGSKGMFTVLLYVSSIMLYATCPLIVCAVNGTNLVKKGGTVRYTMKLTNGAQTVHSTGDNTLSLTVDNAQVVNTTCRRNLTGFLVPLHPMPLDYNITVEDVIFCSFDIQILDVHVIDGEIPGLMVQAAYLPAKDILFIPTITGLTSPIPVYTNATMSMITYSVDTTSPTAIYGEPPL